MSGYKESMIEAYIKNAVLKGSSEENDTVHEDGYDTGDSDETDFYRDDYAEDDYNKDDDSKPNDKRVLYNTGNHADRNESGILSNSNGNKKESVSYEESEVLTENLKNSVYDYDRNYGPGRYLYGSKNSRKEGYNSHFFLKEEGTVTKEKGNLKKVKEKLSEAKREFKEEVREKQEERYKEEQAEAVEEQTEAAASGDVPEYAYAKAKETGNKVINAGRKVMNAAADVTEAVTTAPEMLSKNYSKAKRAKQEIEHMDVEAAAKEAAKGTVSVTSGILKKVHKLIKQWLPFIGAISGVIAAFFVVVIVFIIVVAVLASGAASDTVSDETGDSGRHTDTSMYVFYNQGDYTTSMGGGQTIAQSGCGLTCLASVIATWTGNTNVTPVTVVNYAKTHHTVRGASGVILVSSELYGGMAGEFSLTYETASVTKDNITNALSDGKSIIAMLTSASKWTDGTYVTSRTHFVALIGFNDDGTIACMNPAGGKRCDISMNTILADSGCTVLHIFYDKDKLSGEDKNSEKNKNSEEEAKSDNKDLEVKSVE